MLLRTERGRGVTTVIPPLPQLPTPARAGPVRISPGLLLGQLGLLPSPPYIPTPPIMLPPPIAISFCRLT